MSVRLNCPGDQVIPLIPTGINIASDLDTINESFRTTTHSACFESCCGTLETAPDLYPGTLDYNASGFCEGKAPYGELGYVFDKIRIKLHMSNCYPNYILKDTLQSHNLEITILSLLEIGTLNTSGTIN